MTKKKTTPNIEDGILISAVSEDDFKIMRQQRPPDNENLSQDELLQKIKAVSKDCPSITLKLKDGTHVDGIFQGITADVDDEGEALGYNVIGLLNHNDVLLIPDYLIDSLIQKQHRRKKTTWKIVRMLVLTSLMVTSIVIIFLMNPRFNKVNVLSRHAYYTEDISDVGFIIRSYYDIKTNDLIAESFGYKIMDDSVDIDGDGKDELLCTCEWGGDGKIELFIYKDTINGIVRGSFSPKYLNLDDIRQNGATDFICYYLPASGTIQAEYWTDNCLKLLTLTYDKACYELFPEQNTAPEEDKLEKRRSGFFI